MILLRALARLVTFLLLVALAITGLVAAIFCIGGGKTGLSLPGLADLLHLSDLRDQVSSRLSILEGDKAAPGSALVGLGTVLLGILLLIGLLAPRRERVATLEKGSRGTLTARRRPLAQLATALAEQVRGVTEVKARVRLGRRAGSGRLIVLASRPRTTPSDEVERGVADAVSPVAEPFGLRTRVLARVGRGGARVR